MGEALFVLAVTIEYRMVIFSTKFYLQVIAVKLDLMFALKESKFVPSCPLAGLYLVIRKQAHQSEGIKKPKKRCVWNGFTPFSHFGPGAV
jgi:predicted small secreted protein